MKIPLSTRGLPPDDECTCEFKCTIGRFIWAFAEIERVMFYSLVTVLKMPLDIAKAVFTDARIDKAKHQIKRLRKANGLNEDKFLEEAFNHLADITRLRNDIAHYGATYESDGKFKVSDELWKLEGARVYLIDKSDLEKATADLAVIRHRLAFYMLIDWSEPDESQYVPFPWQYKPSQPIRQLSNSTPNPPKRPRQPPSSDG